MNGNTVHRKDLESVLPNNQPVALTCPHEIWQEQIQLKYLTRVYEEEESNLHKL